MADVSLVFITKCKFGKVFNIFDRLFNILLLTRAIPQLSQKFSCSDKSVRVPPQCEMRLYQRMAAACRRFKMSLPFFLSMFCFAPVFFPYAIYFPVSPVQGKLFPRSVENPADFTGQNTLSILTGRWQIVNFIYKFSLQLIDEKTHLCRAAAKGRLSIYIKKSHISLPTASATLPTCANSLT